MAQLKEINGRYYKPAEVVMVTTNVADNALLLLNLRGSKHLEYFNNKYFTQAYLKNSNLSSQHLYITSDEEIKDGDNILIIKSHKDLLKNDIIKYNSSIQSIDINNCKKIIATTDKSLIYKDKDDEILGRCQLPQPSTQFIKAYIEAYNNGKPITKVMVEYNEFLEMNDPTGKYTTYELKRDKDNTITIKSIKDSWSREEVINLLHLFGVNINDIEKQTVCPVNYIDEWIEQNL